MNKRRLSILATVAALLLPAAPAAGAVTHTRDSRSATCAVIANSSVAPRDATPHPSKAECNRAKKILTQWNRLAQKLGVRISKKRREALRRKTNNGTIKVSDLPATLRRGFPSELDRFDLNQI